MAKPLTADQQIAAFKKWGVNYKEYPGWRTRTRPGGLTDVAGVVNHHTGGGSASASYLKFLFVDGRPEDGIPGPLCNVATDTTGIVHLGAIGRANHAGSGSATTLAHVRAEDYRGFSAELEPGPDGVNGNPVFYGNEWIYSGTKPPSAAQYRGALLYNAALLDAHGWTALSAIAHREWTDRKNDPYGVLMYKFRIDLAALLKAGPTKPAPPEDDMADLRNDVVGNDADGSDMTFAELSARMGGYTYQAMLDNGKVGKALIDIQATLADVVARLERIEDDTDGTP